jgi:hypothetical protein
MLLTIARPTLMPSVNLRDAGFYGRTSTPAPNQPCYSLECRHCGSSLRGRLVDRTHRTIARVRYAVDVFRCPCGHDRQVRRAM